MHKARKGVTDHNGKKWIVGASFIYKEWTDYMLISDGSEGFLRIYNKKIYNKDMHKPNPTTLITHPKRGQINKKDRRVIRHCLNYAWHRLVKHKKSGLQGLVVPEDVNKLRHSI